MSGGNFGVSDAGVVVASGTKVTNFDPVTGQPRWSYADAAQPDPLIRVGGDPSGGVVVIEASSDTVVLDAATGEVRSRLDMRMPVAVAGELLVYADRDSTGALEVFDDGGERQWQADLPDQCDLGQMSWLDKVAAQDGRVYVAAFCPDGLSIFSFRAEDGAERRHVVVSDTESTNCFRLDAGAGLVAVRTCEVHHDPEQPDEERHTSNVIHLLDADELEPRWRTELGEWNTVNDTGIAVNQHGVYTVGPQCGEVLALDVSTGDIVRDRVDLGGRMDCVYTLAASRGMLVGEGVDGVTGIR